MKKLVSAVSVWWTNVLALLPTSKTRKHVAVLKTELEHTQNLVVYWREVHETYYVEHQKLQKQLEEKKTILTNAIARIDWLLAEKTALVSEINNANAHGLRLEAQVSRLTASVSELERQREVLFELTEAHRDARREISSVLAKLGKKDPMQFPKPKPEEIQKQAISYRTPTVEDLKNGPIAVEVSIDGSKWEPRTLQRITRGGLFVCKFEESLSTKWFSLARIPDQQPAKNDATPNQTH